MSLLLDSCWRALAYCLHPRVILLSLLPVLLMAAGVFALGYYLWYPAQAALLAWLEGWQLLTPLQSWLDLSGLGTLASVLAPLLLLVLATPLLVLLALLLVGLFMTPAMVKLVAQRRFAHLECRRGASFLDSLWWSLGSTLLALVMLLASLPLWLIPPLALLLPPLVWGWLGYRVYAFDALADHADAVERAELLARHRSSLWLMGLVCGLLGAAPSLLWTSGAMFIAMAPLLVPLAVWVYALVFAFSSLWFAHYLLAALARLRASPAQAAQSLVSGIDSPQ